MTTEKCLVCREHRGDVDVPGGLVETREGAVLTFHVPLLFAPTAYAGHLMVTPRRHVADFAGLTPDEARSVGAAIQQHSAALKALGAARVYVATVGHGVDHLHVHLLPRWPETPDDVRWVEVDEWDGARRLSAEEIAALMDDLRRHLP